MDNRLLIVSIGMVAGLLAIGLIEYMDTHAHESAHKRAYEFYGIESNITIRLTEGETQADHNSYADLATKDRQQLDMMNMVNEAVGYNLLGIKAILYAIFYVIYAQFLVRLFYENN